MSRITDNIITSLKKYEERKIDIKFVFNKKRFSKQLLEIESSDTGIISSIDWKKIQDNLIQYHRDIDLWMEWYKSIGDWSHKGEKLAVLYRYFKEDDSYFLKKGNLIPKFFTKDIYINNDKINDKDRDSSTISTQITSAIQVLNDKIYQTIQSLE